ncbi:MAG: RDD family protein [Xanthomonadaceae bacterium]|nr:RDD family protein [Xanthomonadaceae bacterium]MDE1964884.1 RDD family protein [Xanthomonadaceae bacterium]
MDIWIGRNGERHGPYKEVDVRGWLRSGELAGDDLGWHDGMADWQPLGSLFPEELNPAGSATPPPFAASSASSPAPASGQATTAAVEDYAGFWKRFGAWVIDYIVLMLPSGVILAQTSLADSMSKLFAASLSGGNTQQAMADYVQAVQAARPAMLLVVAIGFIYYTLMESSPLQATLGKLAVGIRVTDMDGRRLGMGRSAGRNAVRLLNMVTGIIPFIAYLAIAWTQRKQGLHDLLAKALVLNGRAAGGRPTQPARGGGNFSA